MMIWLRSFDPGELVYNGGYLSELNDVIPELADFPSAAINAWASDDGVIYGVPIAGVTHGVFYQGDIFDKYGLEEPATWAEFIDLCQTLKDNGEIVFAQGTGDGWPLYEVIFSGLGANFYGGEKSRQALMAGDMKLTDEPFVNAFKAEDQLQQFFRMDTRLLIMSLCSRCLEPSRPLCLLVGPGKLVFLGMLD